MKALPKRVILAPDMSKAPYFSDVDPALIELIGASEPLLLDPAFAVYTNRDLDLSKIEVVGFDMDYTLASYHRQPMELLQYKLTVEYLIKYRGYPAEIRKMAYDPNLIIRGLVVDKRLGHVLKMDVLGHIWRAIHGRRQLNEAEIQETYTNIKIKVGSPQFATLDTLFAMPEACLYCNLVDFYEERHARSESLVPMAPTPEQKNVCNLNAAKLFDDVRNAIDTIHSDGSLKSIIVKDMATYIEANSDIALTLHKLRSVGKRIFLLTNSHWRYTNAVMSYLLDKRLPEYASWRSYFDTVIVGSGKPSFFVDTRPFYELDTAKHTSDSDVDISEKEAKSELFDRNKIYMGGNIRDFETKAQCKGEQILYIGDHIYGDILRSRKANLWRTCLIVEELPLEIQLVIRYARDIDRVSEMEAERLSIDTNIGNRRALLAHVEAAIRKEEEHAPEGKRRSSLMASAKEFRLEIDLAKRFLRELDESTMAFQDELERRFHPHWGRLFREHSELTRFGAQVTSYACIYTGKLTNLLQYSPVHIFRSAGELMCHDRTLQNSVQFRKARLHHEGD